MSVVYQVGTGWFGGFLPATLFAIVAKTGDIFAGLWYAVVIATTAVVVSPIRVKETRGNALV